MCTGMLQVSQLLPIAQRPSFFRHSPTKQGRFNYERTQPAALPPCPPICVTGGTALLTGRALWLGAKAQPVASGAQQQALLQAAAAGVTGEQNSGVQPHRPCMVGSLACSCTAA